MGVRGISGVIVPKDGKHNHGTVKINLTTGNVSANADAEFKEAAAFGTGAFKKQPCKSVSLRHVSVKDRDTTGVLAEDKSHWDKLNLDDHWVKSNDTYTHLTVEWFGKPSTTNLKEISVIVFGETEDD